MPDNVKPTTPTPSNPPDAKAPVKAKPADAPDAGHIPITEEMDSAKWTLPPIVPAAHSCSGRGNSGGRGGALKPDEAERRAGHYQSGFSRAGKQYHGGHPDQAG